LKKIAILYGTRPEFVKVAPIIDRLSRSSTFEVVPISTGQHLEMLNQMEDQFQIFPAVDLKIFKPGQTLSQIVEKTLFGLGAYFNDNKPDLFIVQGDTTSAMAGAIAAFYNGIPVAHVEAGLRSFDLANPFPEEANRKIISQISSLHLAPTPLARENLLAEGISADEISVTGNTVIDALGMSLTWDVAISDERVKNVLDQKRKYILVTTHRRENLGSGMASICEAILQLSKTHPDIDFVFPMHKNPAVRNAMAALQIEKNVILCEPLSYSEFVKVMSCAFLVLTDSGGVQEEAPAFKIPVLVLRETTERPEAVEAGVAKLVGTHSWSIVKEVTRLLENPDQYSEMAAGANPYGDGEASRRIELVIENYFGHAKPIDEFIPGSK
jgi:UDP-N-acetylglucosamine 2-epimerase (non-hydrolysing)